MESDIQTLCESRCCEKLKVAVEEKTKTLEVTLNEARQANNELEAEIARHRETQKNLEERHYKLLLTRAIINHSENGVITLDAEAIVLIVNDAYTRITSYSSDNVIGKPLRFVESDTEQEALNSSMWEALNQNDSWIATILCQRKNGKSYYLRVSVKVLLRNGDEVINYFAIVRDVSDEEKAKENALKFREMAYRDYLTDLDNREAFMDKANKTLSMAKRHQQILAIMMIDINRFKEANDTFGHQAGDVLLQEVARRLIGILRIEDLIARLGGDEFAGAMLIEKEEHAIILAEGILAKMRDPFVYDGQTLQTDLSIGIAIFPSNGMLLGDLLRSADNAMYAAKTKRKKQVDIVGACCVFDSSMRASDLERIHMETSIRRAFETSGFEIFIQPQVDANGRIFAGEVLLRLFDQASGKYFDTKKVIMIIEKIGQTIALGDFILEKVCEQLNLWKDQAVLVDINLSLNVSKGQFFDRKFFYKILEAITCGFEANRLTFEITEAELITDHILDTLKQLRAIGLNLHLDDFASNHSRLKSLVSGIFSAIKIDRFWTAKIFQKEESLQLKNLTKMMRSCKIKVIIEGVESAQQLVQLKRIIESVESELQSTQLEEAMAYAYQGYFFSEPVPVKTFEDLVLKSQHIAQLEDWITHKCQREMQIV